MIRTPRIILTICCLLFLVGSFAAQAQQSVMVDANAPGSPLPHFWEEMFGSGRAILALRESYRDDLREVKKATAFRYVRFHNVLHDEVGVYDEDDQGKPIYNFTYVDQIYDGTAEERRASRGRDQFHAQEAGFRSQCAPSFLVQAKCLASQGLCEVGRI